MHACVVLPRDNELIGNERIATATTQDAGSVATRQTKWLCCLRLDTRTCEREGEGEDATADGGEGDAAQVVLHRKAGVRTGELRIIILQRTQQNLRSTFAHTSGQIKGVLEC
jgi:hypothetical protein